VNRQVPEKIAIIGNGRVAQHMMAYFDCVGQPYVQWFRPSSGTKPAIQPQSSLSKLAGFKDKLKKLINPPTPLTEVIADVRVVLLLIPDDQILPCLATHHALKDKTCVHFSGSLYTDLAYGCHPLMTFGGDLYTSEQYQKIPFVVDEGVDFKALFPLFPNPVHSIKATDKIKYHAFCVMAGNFSQLLWQAIGQEMKSMGLSKEVLSVYLLQNTQNFITNPSMAATGPFVRGDDETIEKHQVALQGHPLADIYQAFFDWQQAPAEKDHRNQQ
jgi:predicted short-subunit dehydrogenase-like oxidoreductase (DUF2520 family)